MLEINHVRPLAVKRRAAAAMLGIGTTKLDELIARGEIAAKKSGKNLLVLTDSLQAYLTSLPTAQLALPRHLRNKNK